MTTLFPYLESGQQELLKTSLAFALYVQLISNMHHYDKGFHLIYIFPYLLTSAKFNIFDGIHIYDVIVRITNVKYKQFLLSYLLHLINLIHSESIFAR